LAFSELAFSDPAMMRAVLTLATQAPSMHNAQPWRWRVGPDSLSLFADPSRYLRPAGPDHRGLLVSCGTALHHCTVALAAMGWHSRVERLPDPSDPNHLATFSVSAQPPGELDVTLAAAIGRRRTDRRTYSSGPVPWDNIALMGARAARAGVMLRQVEPSPRLNAIITDAVAHSDNPDCISEPNDSRGSVAVASAGDDNAVVVALGTELDDDLSRLRAGEATSLVLLSATAMGLASCPLTEPLDSPETREAVRADVFGDDGHPQMLMRLGWTEVNAEPLPPSPRRRLTDVADWAAPAVKPPD